MKNNLIGGINPLAPAPKAADKARIRQFVKELSEVALTIKDASEDLKEAINSNEEIQSIDEQIKQLRESRKDVILNNPVIQGYNDILNDAKEEKRQLISDAKDDGVPRKEIDFAIKALKQDVDISVSTEIYTNIADLVE